MNDESEHDEWTELWDARLAAMETVLGKSADVVGHGAIPFHLGADLGGTADIVYFRNHVDGVISATAELIGNPDQKPGASGRYELLIAARDDDNWGPNIIGQLAHYTLDTVLEPGQTMDIGPASPDGSAIVAFLFCDFGRVHVLGDDAGLLLCIGITDSELAACRSGERAAVETALRSCGVFPFTDHQRESVV